MVVREIVAVFLGLLVAGCASAPPVQDAPIAREITRRAAVAGERVAERRDVERLAVRPPARFEAGMEAARTLFEAGRRRDAAWLFGHVAARWPEHAHAPTALFNAGVTWMNVGDRDRSLAALTQIVERYPERELASAALAELTLLWEEGGRLEPALAALLTLLARAPVAEWERWDAAARACQLAWTLERADDAVRACRLAARSGAKRGVAASQYLLAGAEVVEGAGRLSEAARLVDEALRAARKDPAAEVSALTARARVARARGQTAVARKAQDRILRLASASPEGGLGGGWDPAGERVRGPAAEILLERADALAAKADAIELDTRDLAALRRSLEVRTKAMREAASAYEAVFGLRAAGPSVRAAVGTGRLYERFCDALRATPRVVPDDLHDAYAPLLEGVLAPLEDRAIQAYEVALRPETVAPEAAEEAASALLRLRPDRYPVGRVAALGLPWGPGAPTLGAPEDEAAVRRAVWERPSDLAALLDLAAVEHGAGRDRVAAYYLQRVWASERLRGQGEVVWLRAAAVAAALDRVGLASWAVARGVEAPDATGRASVLRGAEALARVGYAEAAEAFGRAAGAEGATGCDATLGAALAAVGLAEGDPTGYPSEGLAAYIARCPSPDPLAYLWLARARDAAGDDPGAITLCGRYLGTPSPDDPTSGRAFCEALVAAHPGGVKM